MGGLLPITPTDFFEKFVESPEIRPGLTTPCLVWTGKRNDYGYGTVTSSGLLPGRSRSLLTHRVLWILRRGPIPEGLSVCHECDNPPCGNEAHLFLGTHKENMQDSVRKGRNAKRARNGHAVLTEVQVAEIRVLAKTTSTPAVRIAQQFGIATSTVYSLLNASRWREEGPVVRPEWAYRQNRGRKLTPEKAEEIRSRVASGESQTSVARDYDIAQATVSKIVQRKIRMADPGPPGPTYANARKVTPEMAKQIWARAAEGVDHVALASDFGISRRTVHRIAHGDIHQGVTGGGRIPSAVRKLTVEEIAMIKERLALGHLQKAIARDLRVSPTRVSQIKVHGR